MQLFFVDSEVVDVVEWIFPFQVWTVRAVATALVVVERAASERSNLAHGVGIDNGIVLYLVPTFVVCDCKLVRLTRAEWHKLEHSNSVHNYLAPRCIIEHVWMLFHELFKIFFYDGLFHQPDKHLREWLDLAVEHLKRVVLVEWSCDQVLDGGCRIRFLMQVIDAAAVVVFKSVVELHRPLDSDVENLIVASTRSGAHDIPGLVV